MMTGPTSPKPGRNNNPWAQMGLAMMIPSIMVAGPVVGFLIAWFIGRWTGWHARWFTALLVLLGMMAGVRETIRIIRKIS